jgi:hypothetical protein
MNTVAILKTSNGMHLLVPTEMLLGKYAFTIRETENAAAVYLPIGRG